MATTSRYELDFLDEFTQCEEGKLSIQKLSAVIAEKLNELRRWARVIEEDWDAENMGNMVERFEFIADDTTASKEELDDVLEDLYDWADNSVFDEDAKPIPGMILCRVRSAAKTGE